MAKLSSCKKAKLTGEFFARRERSGPKCVERALSIPDASCAQRTCAIERKAVASTVRAKVAEKFQA
jgi:hypothetical protein